MGAGGGALKAAASAGDLQAAKYAGIETAIGRRRIAAIEPEGRAANIRMPRTIGISVHGVITAVASRYRQVLNDNGRR